MRNAQPAGTGRHRPAMAHLPGHLWLWGLLAATIALATGCASAPAPQQPAADTGPAPTAAPKVDRVVFALQQPSIEYQDVRHLNTPNEWPLDPMYESLMGVDANTGKIVPVLSTAWKIDTQTNSIRYQLRKGVKFHKDNGEFTAKDVVVKMREKVKDEPAAAIQSSSIYWRGLLKNVEVVNDYEVVYHLNAPSGLVLEFGTDQFGGASIFSSQSYEKLGIPQMNGEALAGTGPYQYDTRVQQQYIRFTRIPYKHWRTDADFPAFEFRWVKEASTRMAALLAGEVHLTDLPDDLQKQAVGQGFKTVQGRVPAFRTFVTFQCCQFKDPKNPALGYIDPTSPLADIRVRRALAKSVNYDELNKSLFGGKGERMLNNPLHPTRPGWDPSWEKRWPELYGFDVGAARSLLTQAGYNSTGNPLKVNLRIMPVAGLSAAQDAVEAIGSYWRNAGIEVTLKTGDAPPNPLGNPQVYNEIAISATSSTPWTGIFNYGSSLQHRNPGPEQADADQVLDKIRNTMDYDAQEPMWKDVGEKLFTANHFVPLFWLPTVAVVNPKIVADYVFPGSITGTWTHIEGIKAVR